MASKASTRRLTKEYKAISTQPPPFIQAKPLESNILEWHYILKGPEGTPYEGGCYHGKLVFPPEYPFKPPSIQMITPSGRFETNTRLCLSISDFHPDTWNPAWSVATILNGLLSFMTSSDMTTGSIQSSDADKRKFAKASHQFNSKNKRFRELFPELIQIDIKDDEQPSQQDKNKDKNTRASQDINKHPIENQNNSTFSMINRIPKLDYISYAFIIACLLILVMTLNYFLFF